MASDVKLERLFAIEQGGKFIVKLLSDEKSLSRTDVKKDGLPMQTVNLVLQQ